MAKHKIEFDCECEACEGTGIYQGMAERDGSGVVCVRCNGTGKVHQVIEYRDFIKRKKAKGVTHVVQCNPGICIGVGKYKEYRLSDFGGMPYQEWAKDKPFPGGSEMRRFTCPAWWYQTADYSRKPDWDWCNASLGCSFSHCKRFNDKDECWARWDKENREG